MSGTAIDPPAFRRVLGHYPTGVCVVTSVEAGGGSVGLVVGSFASVSLDPPLVGFFPARTSSSWPRIAATARFCVNVLAQDQIALCRRFSIPGGDKFAGVTHRWSPNGLPILDGVVAWIECDLHAVYEAGDHVIVLGAVTMLEVDRVAPPLLFFQGSYGTFAPLMDR